MDWKAKLYFELPNKTFKTEALFTTWFLWCIRKRWGFAHKISDFSPGDKPRDADIAFEWLAAAVELKKTDNGSCRPYQLLRWSSPKNPGAQVSSLDSYARNGWNSLVIVYSTKKHRYVILDFRHLDFNTKISFDEMKN